MFLLLTFPLHHVVAFPLSRFNSLSNIVSIPESGSKYLCFEWCDQDLAWLLRHTEGALPLTQVKAFTNQLLRALEHCHMRCVMHRHVKPAHILINNNGCLKLCGFSSARSFIPPIRPFSEKEVTLWYCPPEILLGCKIYGLSVDMWSVACIIIEMVTKRPFLPGDSEIDQIFKTFQVLGTPTEATWPGVTSLKFWNDDFPEWTSLELVRFTGALEDTGVDLCERLLTLDPKNRLSARECLRHPYFNDFVDEYCELGVGV